MNNNNKRQLVCFRLLDHNDLVNEHKKIILNGCSILAERFSQIDTRLVHEQLRQAQSNQEKITPKMKKVVKRADLSEKISALFLGFSKMQANLSFIVFLS